MGESHTPKPPRTSATNASIITGDPALFGDQQVESTADNNQGGLAEAFPVSGQVTGTARVINIYLDSHSTATTVMAAIYANRYGQPGILLASAKLSSPRAGAWNSLPITATAVSGSTSYWIAILGRGGTIYFRDRTSGPCTSENSRNTGLTSLPTTWTGGSQWSTCPVSAFVAGTASAVSTSGSDPGTTSTTTTTSSTTTTTSSATTTTSSPPPPVSPPTSAPISLLTPQVAGAAMQSQILSTGKGTWLNGPDSYGYQWEDCDSTGASCAAIAGATGSSYMLVRNDVGHTVRVVVTATNAGGSASAASSQTGVVQPLPAPTNSGLPQISGTAQQSQTLSASNGSWTGSPTSYAYQWSDCDPSGANCSNISGATGSSYVLAGNDVGDTLRVAVTAGNAGGSAAASSGATAVVTASSSTTDCAGTPGSRLPNAANMDACGFPSPDNTGVPAGTTLAPRSGDITASTPGEVISGISLTNGTINVTANDVTIENSSITAGDGQLNGTSAIYIADGVSGTVVRYVTMQGSNCQGGSLFAGVMNQGGDQLIMDHVYGNCIDDILHGSGTLSNSYSIDNPTIPNDHYEPVADDGGNGALTIDHDTLLDAHDQTAAVFTQCTFGDVSKLTIANSLLGGGDFAVYGPTSDPCGPGTGAESVTNNRFTRLYYPDGGQYGAAAYFPSNTTWTGNVWDDTNATVSAP
jgi:hypothetical protein